VFAALLVAGPVLRQVQGAVDDGVAAAGGEGEMDGDLAQADSAEGLYFNYCPMAGRWRDTEV